VTCACASLLMAQSCRLSRIKKVHYVRSTQAAPKAGSFRGHSGPCCGKRKPAAPDPERTLLLWLTFSAGDRNVDCSLHYLARWSASAEIGVRTDNKSSAPANSGSLNASMDGIPESFAACAAVACASSDKPRDC